jgi:hypothetical protein
MIGGKYLLPAWLRCRRGLLLDTRLRVPFTFHRGEPSNATGRSTDCDTGHLSCGHSPLTGQPVSYSRG